MKIQHHINQLDSYILNNLNTTKESLKEWESGHYFMDSRTVTMFWDEIDKAPSVKIIGDYDTDGICASYIMAYSIGRVYKQKPIKIRLPRRFSEGYGFNQTIVDEIKEKDAPGTLIITVDNGITAGPLLEDLERSGFPVIVTDHHEFNRKIPQVTMVLNPKVKGCNEAFDGDYWCGAGVAYKLCEQMLDNESQKLISIYAGIATIGDIMPLVHGNWGLVRNMIQIFQKEEAPPSLTCLINMLEQNPKYADTETFSYYLCPAFNASGRLYDNGASQILSYLFKPTVEKAKEIIKINNERKKIRDDQTAEVIQAIYDRHLENACPIWIDLPNLHEGIIGIIASEIVKKFNVPAIVLTEKENGILKGSARSIGDIHILNYLNNTGADYLKIGGHAGAAGLSITREEYSIAKLSQISKPQIEKSTVFSISHDEIPDICEELKTFIPFGEGNPNPILTTVVDMNTDNVKMIGKDQNHLMIKDQSDSGPYKITHFYHLPNSLVNKNKFILEGTISESNFNDEEIPTFDAKEIREYDLNEHELDREDI